jgi:GrpB-like predicted nucleotidyltransferase (UPF0157 family)
LTEWFGEPIGDPVILTDPDPRWPLLFDRFRLHLLEVLGEVALRIDQVGSTAVPGLPAKPVIDIQVSVADISDEDSYRPAIESLGLPLRGRESDHRFFRPPAGSPRTVHVHVCAAGSRWERQHLLFVHYLREQPKRAREYAQLKLGLADHYRSDRTRYTEGKNEFIEETLRMAEGWAANTEWQP